jgi:hypothetical protein
MKTLRREQLGETTSAEILLPQLAEEIESLSLSDTTSTRFPLGLENSVASYSAIFHRKNLAQNYVMTWIAPQFDSYPNSGDDFESDLLNFPSLTIMATPQSRVIYWKGSESTGSLDNARLVACLQDLPYQLGRPLSPIGEEEIGDIALVDYSTTHSTPNRQVYVSLQGEESALESQTDQYANENLDQISDDELSVNAPHDESQQDRDS